MIYNIYYEDYCSKLFRLIGGFEYNKICYFASIHLCGGYMHCHICTTNVYYEADIYLAIIIMTDIKYISCIPHQRKRIEIIIQIKNIPKIY